MAGGSKDAFLMIEDTLHPILKLKRVLERRYKIARGDRTDTETVELLNAQGDTFVAEFFKTLLAEGADGEEFLGDLYQDEVLKPENFSVELAEGNSTNIDLWKKFSNEVLSFYTSYGHKETNYAFSLHTTEEEAPYTVREFLIVKRTISPQKPVLEP